MKTVYCIALIGGITGSLWFHDKAMRDAALGTNAVEREVPFKLNVPESASDELITEMVDTAETLDNYVPEIGGATDNEQRILQELRDERDAWMQAHADLNTQVEWMRERQYLKQVECLTLARDHAGRLRQHTEEMYNTVYATINPKG